MTKRDPVQLRRRHEATIARPVGQLTTVSAWLVWLLGHGWAVTTDDAVDLRRTRSLVNGLADDLRAGGWEIQVTHNGGRTSRATFRATRRPDGEPIAANHGPRPVCPVSAHADEERRRRDRQRKAEWRAKGAAVAVEHVPATANGHATNGRAALLRDAPRTPPLGAPVRVAMVAEHDDGAVMALHDEHGAVWFARLVDHP